MEPTTEGFDYYGILLPKLPPRTMAAGAMLLLKTIDEHGKVVYNEMRAGELHPVEALGMITSAADTLKNIIATHVQRKR